LAPWRHLLLRAASFTTRRVLSLIAGSPCSAIGAVANLGPSSARRKKIWRQSPDFLAVVLGLASKTTATASRFCSWSVGVRLGAVAGVRLSAQRCSCPICTTRSAFVRVRKNFRKFMSPIRGGSWRFGRYALRASRIRPSGFCAWGGMGVPCGFGRLIRDSPA
jgi:hypothetical protein